MIRKQILTHLKAEGNYTWLHYLDGERELKSITLKRYEALYPHFFRIHKGALVNPALIQSIQQSWPAPAKTIVLINGVQLPLSRRRWPLINKALLAALSPTVTVCLTAGRELTLKQRVAI